MMFQIGTNGLNGTTRSSIRAARVEVARLAQDYFGDTLDCVTTDFTIANKRTPHATLIVNGFSVRVNASESHGNIPTQAKIDAVNIYGEDMRKPVPIKIIPRCAL
ncbi:MAG: hypothetical protein AAF549_00760 [Pseudomonadota bacterium]